MVLGCPPWHYIHTRFCENWSAG